MLTAKFAQMQCEVINEVQLLEMHLGVLQAENGRFQEALATRDTNIESPKSSPWVARQRFSLHQVHSPSRVAAYSFQEKPANDSNMGGETALLERSTDVSHARRGSRGSAAQLCAGMRARRSLSEDVDEKSSIPDSPSFHPSLPMAMLPTEEQESNVTQQVHSLDSVLTFQPAGIDAEAPAAHFVAFAHSASGQSSPGMRPQFSRHLAPAIAVAPVVGQTPVLERVPACPCASDSPLHSEGGSSDASFTSELPRLAGVIAPRVQTWSAGERALEFDALFPDTRVPSFHVGLNKPVLKSVRPRHLQQGAKGISCIAGGNVVSVPSRRQNDDSPSNHSRPTVRSVQSDRSGRSPNSSRPNARSKRSGDTDDSRIQYELLQTWSTIISKRPAKRSRMSTRTESSEDGTASAPLDGQSAKTCQTEASAARRVSNFVQRYVMMYPSSPQCIMWDIVSMVLVCYDLVAMPLQVFDPPFQALTGFMEAFARLFWTLTVPRSFFVGYMQKDGEIEMTPSKVMWNYVRGWMCFDSLIAMGDWAAVVMEGMDFIGAVRVTKVMRFLRIVRIMRVARVLKMPVLFENFVQRFHSEKLLLILGIAMYSCIFVVLGHWIACAWFAISTFMSGSGESWTRTLSFADESFSYKYTTSCHWAITQFIGSMEVHPYNVHERTFAVSMLIVSFIGSAAFVSRITASMTRLQIIAESTEREMSILRNFLHHHKVSPDLTMRVIRSARFAQELHAKNIVERDIALLGVISEPLRVEIHYQIYTPVIKAHPFFCHYHASSSAATQKLCHSAIQVISLSMGDTLFTYGESPRVPQMFFLMSGCLVYKYQSVGVERMVGIGMWACEAALWVPWIHLGDMSAGADCGVLGLDAAVLQEVSVKFQSQATFSAVYASKFMNWLNSQQAATDLPHTHDCEACVASAAVQAHDEKPRPEPSQVSRRRVVPQTGAVHSAFGSFFQR